MQSHRLDALDGLRGIAIGLVLWFHLWQISWLDPHIRLGTIYIPFVYFPVAGFLGVELFFFISAFCLSYPYVRAHFAGRSLPSVKHFAYRRFIKIVPSYVLSIVVVIALAAIPAMKASWGANINWPNAGAALFDLGAHLTFLHTYFEETYASINGVLWTLGIEVQYYVIFPVLVLLLLRAPLSLTALMTAIAIVYRVRVGQCCQTGVFDHNVDQLLGFFDYFAAGMFCAFAYEWLRLRAPRLASMQWLWTALAIVGFVWIVLLFQRLEHLRREDHFAEWFVIRNGTFYALAILLAGLGSLLAFPVWRRVLANPVLVFLSVISYNLYLWHQVVLRWIATWPLLRRGTLTHGDPLWEWTSTLCGLVVTIGIASLVTYFFERPLLRMKPQELFRRRVEVAAPE
ncbi:MAG: acyltransferase [Candidatus Eremiobacteraeota bacterium]|nr:acyltransferase [Candidatus Eremiobacteraeota bacterium]